MVKRSIIGSTFVAMALGVAVSTAHAGAICPEWACGSNGTQLNGIALQDAPATGIEVKRTEIGLPREHRPARGTCPEWMCGSNGTRLNGVAVQGAAVHGMEAHNVEVVLDHRRPAPR